MFGWEIPLRLFDAVFTLIVLVFVFLAHGRHPMREFFTLCGMLAGAALALLYRQDVLALLPNAPRSLLAGDQIDVLVVLVVAAAGFLAGHALSGVAGYRYNHHLSLAGRALALTLGGTKGFAACVGLYWGILGLLPPLHNDLQTAWSAAWLARGAAWAEWLNRSGFGG